VADDQKRVLTPGEAIRKGADYIVVGRPVTEATDPLAAVKKIIKEIENQNSEDRSQ
jgi:orotidine-5'-phosphate decarboxylase